MYVRLLILSSLALCAVLCGCLPRHPETYPSPAIPAADSFHEHQPLSAQSHTNELPWWRQFESPELNELIEGGMQRNLELEALWARVQQADSLVSQAGGQLFPSLDAAGEYQTFWNSGRNGARNREQASSVAALLSWELDLWGRIRSAARAREQEAAAARHDWLGARLLLSAAVAETYFQILEQREQLALLEEQIEANETLLSLANLRFGQGLSSVVDVLQQREQLAATRALAPELKARLGELEYALDVLVGLAPGTGGATMANRLPDAPPPPEAGVPSDLLRHRPDLAAAEHRIKALDYRVGEAMASRLPRFTIGASTAAVGDPGVGTLVQSALGSVVLPIFDAGVRKAEVEAREAALKEGLAEYSHAYLRAVQEVETVLMQGRQQAERVRLLREQLEIAQALLMETRHRYNQGLTDYLPVLNAVVTAQDLERRLVTEQRRLASLRVALHRALGGPMEQVRFGTGDYDGAEKTL